MKYIFFGCCLMFVIFPSCKKDEVKIPTCESCVFTCIDMNETDALTNDCIENWECHFKVLPQSKVDIDETHGVASGDKNVFQMINSTQGDALIADDEFTHILVFELDSSQTSFSLDGDALKLAKSHFRRFCFCSETQFMDVNLGCLQGEQQPDGSWFVQGNLIVSYSFGSIDVKFDAQFTN
jgi:hypothetical protein